IPFYESFKKEHIPQDVDLIVHSAAYNPETNAELREAVRRSLKIRKYTDALGEYSADFFSAGICGVHGKTTTTALAGTIIRALGLPAQVLAGSAVSTFAPEGAEARSTLYLGEKYFVAETCEYRGHFLSFNPKIIVLTNIEHDHQDFFPTYQSIFDIFIRYIDKISNGGTLIYCADDRGAAEAAAIARNKGITLIPYGFTAEGDYKITLLENPPPGRIAWTLGISKGRRFSLRVPGRHNVLNAAAATALCATLAQHEAEAVRGGATPDGGSGTAAGGTAGGGTAAGGNATPDGGMEHGRLDETFAKIGGALETFAGSKRRGEIVGEAGGILFMDDYGHHPTAIAATLVGLRGFYPNRRLIVSFMSHTYTRTAALLDAFSRCFAAADMLFLHKIYPSARETYTGEVSGITLFEETKKHHANTYYVDEYMDAIPSILPILKVGDIFLTMGAGDNWKLGKKLYELAEKAEIKP
ncbi:MAG: UDP-N-acetylmuramate--L-alanine ligase, partial [Spirochaetaceae bacterium]|nr:UDP-N-acetylmuramate--L-alanine ligase [Spirochaetaceae bacterium]